MNTHLHKPQPAEDGEACIICDRPIRRVPGGHGPVWVHADGYVLGRTYIGVAQIWAYDDAGLAQMYAACPITNTNGELLRTWLDSNLAVLKKERLMIHDPPIVFTEAELEVLQSGLALVIGQQGQ